MQQNCGLQINVDEISPQRLENILEYIYCGDIHITEKNVYTLLEDSVYTEMTG